MDLGEQEAITLADSLDAELIILDDKAARQIALQRGLVDLSVAIEGLQQTNFRVSPNLVESLLENYRDTE